jgi:hypothetical protein
MKTPQIPEDDSDDLTDEEVARAVNTADTHDLSTRIVVVLRESPGTQLEKHELRRRKPHLYWRARLRSPTGEERVMVFVADWLKQENQP